jgi:hypothetical protein
MELEGRIEHNPVVFAGRQLWCSLRIHNRSQAPQLLAWASAQVHCQCAVNPSRVALAQQQQPQQQQQQQGLYAFSPTRGRE